MYWLSIITIYSSSLSHFLHFSALNAALWPVLTALICFQFLSAVHMPRIFEHTMHPSSPNMIVLPTKYVLCHVCATWSSIPRYNKQHIFTSESTNVVANVVKNMSFQSIEWYILVTCQDKTTKTCGWDLAVCVLVKLCLWQTLTAVSCHRWHHTVRCCNISVIVITYYGASTKSTAKDPTTLDCNLCKSYWFILLSSWLFIPTSNYHHHRWQEHCFRTKLNPITPPRCTNQ